MAIGYNVILGYIAGLVALYVLGWLLLVPLRFLLRLLLNCVLGGVALLALNLLGGGIGLHVSLNPLTALFAGLLGIPGVATLLLLEVLL